MCPRAETSTCFTCTRLNGTTFLIVEDDKWAEFPFIYVKIYDDALVLIDTGCSAARDETAQLTSLRGFLETYPVAENDNRPLNDGSRKGYVVICSHCHFDHIGALEQFADVPKSTIWASSNDKLFIEGDGKLPTSSLCRFFDIKTPKYKLTHWADDGQHVLVGEDGKDLGLVTYHTPGHTPDQIAIWDPQERVLFVGDTMYEWAHIIFPLEGSLRLYSDTLGKLRSLVGAWNAVDARKRRVKIACGHISSASDAQQLIDDVDLFLYRVAENMVESKEQGMFRDERLISYDREDGKISFAGPKKLFDQLRADDAALQAIRERQGPTSINNRTAQLNRLRPESQ